MRRPVLSPGLCTLALLALGTALALLLDGCPRPLAAQEIGLSGACPLGEATFALGTTVTLTDLSASAASQLSLDPSYLPCVPITFTAQNVTGKPPLTLSWTLDNRLQYPGLSTTLDTTTLAAGLHTMTFRAANTAGTATRSVPFTLQALAFALPPAYKNLGNSTARFTANTSGATEWRWTWGDGTATAWLAGCPGYAPTHTYPRPGTYAVRAEARNCRDAPVAVTFSASVTATLAPRVLTFQAACPYGFCIFPQGIRVLFEQAFAGTPTVYRYDWNGDGAFEQVSATPVASHAYPTAGLYTPVLQVSDGTKTHALAHQGGPILVQTSAPTIPEAPTGLVLDIVGEEFASTPAPTPPTDVWTLTAFIVRPRWTDRSVDEAGFNVYRSIADGAYQLVATTPAGTTSTTNLRLPVGALYRFQATAFGPGGESRPTTPVTLDLRP